MADEPIYLAQQTDLDNHKNATGNVHGMVKGDIGLGNVDNTADANKSVKHATTAGSLATARTITLSGDVSGSVSFNGSKDVTITTTVADDSHNHTIANVDGLQDALDGKESSGAAATALANAKSYTNSAVSTHNTSTSAHSDLRDLISALQTKLNNFLDVDDTTTDQLSELIALIQDNATDIEAITSGKVNVTDIVNNLTTNVANKPLSAAQGVALKALIDALQTAVDGKAASGHTHSAATTSAAGFMSADDKTKLNGIAAGANKYSHPTTSGNKHIPAGGSSGQILRWSADGTAAWGDDSNTTYSAATQSAAGLMSADDKKKLDGIATGANKYTLPTAGSTLGGVKTTSTVTSTSGLTACPIIGGVPYYKDTNNTYSLSTFGITATAAELNYMDGVTSAVQTQINNLVNRVAALEELLAYYVGVDSTGVYVEEGV